MLQNSLQADSRKAHRENVARQHYGGEGVELHTTIRLQNAALFCLAALGTPQASADLQAKGCVLEREERLIGGLSEGDAVHFKTGDALFPGYTISVVISLKMEQCGKAEQPMFQALVVTTGCNIPNIYVNLQDYHCWVQVPTNSGRLESVATSRDLLHEQMPLTITIVVDGLLVYCYFNENFALEKPKRLSNYALPLKTGEIACGRHPKLIAEKGDTRGDIYMAGAMMLLRLFPRPMVLHEVQSVARASRTVATKILKRRGQKDAPVSAETPVTVRNIIEVTQLVIQFTQVQLSDDLTQQMGKKSKGLQELMDPDTIMWMVLALGTASMYLPHQHPKYLELIKQPFVKTLQMVAGIIEAVISAERKGAGLSPHEQAFVTAASVYVSHILESPRGKNIMVDELAATLIIKMIPFTDRSIDLSEFVIKRCHTLSPRVAILLLNSRQESMATGPGARRHALAHRERRRRDLQGGPAGVPHGQGPGGHHGDPESRGREARPPPRAHGHLHEQGGPALRQGGP